MFFFRSTTGRMTRRILSLVLVAVCIVSVSLIGGVPTTDAAGTLTDATVKKYEEQIADLAKKANDCLANITNLRNQQASWQEQKAEIDTYLNTVERKMDMAETLYAEISNQIAITMAEIEATQAEYDKAYEQFLDQMVLTYEEGDASYLGLLLGADSLSDFLVRMEYVNSMMAYKKSVMDTLMDKRETLQSKEAELNEKLKVQEETIAQLEVDRAAYEKEANNALSQIAQLEKNESAALKTYYAYKAEEDKLDKELEEYLLELQRQNQQSMEAGDWLWPIPLTTDQYCSSRYGWRILYGVWDYHRGWDIACWLGTNILASKSGTVVIATWHNSYGNYVVIDHGDGISTVYAHASKLLVSKGDTVKQGDVIAKVGTTGNSTGYHLHFEFRKNGKYTDPFEFIPEPPITVGASRYEKW